MSLYQSIRELRQGNRRRHPSPAKHRRRLAVESLEQRALLSGYGYGQGGGVPAPRPAIIAILIGAHIGGGGGGSGRDLAHVGGGAGAGKK
jgi:hypothetical protein